MPVDGQLIHLTYSPVAATEVAFAESVTQMHETVRRFDEETRNRSWSRELAYSDLTFDLAARDGAARFQTVDLVLDLEAGLPRITCRSEFGPGTSSVDPAAWAPSPSVDFVGALARFDVSTAAMKAVPVPGDGPVDFSTSHGQALRFPGAGRSSGLPMPPNGSCLKFCPRVVSNGIRFDCAVAETGWPAWPVALPFAVLAATRRPLTWNAGVGPQAMLRFERFGWANPAFGAPDVFWGMLPAGAGPEDIACSVDEAGRGCRGKRRMAPKRINNLGGAWARTVEVEGRVVVLASRDRKALSSLAPSPTAGPVPPLRGVVSSKSLERLLHEAGFDSRGTRMIGSASLSGRSLIVSARLSNTR